MRRLLRLEDRFGSSIETECSRRLHERIKAGRRRVAEMRESLGLPPPEYWPPSVEDGHLPVIERLHRGRDRVALAYESPDTVAQIIAEFLNHF
jgi:hypothetical protein